MPVESSRFNDSQWEIIEYNEGPVIQGQNVFSHKQENIPKNIMMSSIDVFSNHLHLKEGYHEDSQAVRGWLKLEV